jgi:hypothetical protein
MEYIYTFKHFPSFFFCFWFWIVCWLVSWSWCYLIEAEKKKKKKKKKRATIVTKGHHPRSQQKTKKLKTHLQTKKCIVIFFELKFKLLIAMDKRSIPIKGT